VFAGKKSAQIREILISESAWEEMTCLFAPSLAKRWVNFSLMFTNKIHAIAIPATNSGNSYSCVYVQTKKCQR
jgi:hypothetical protein